MIDISTDIKLLNKDKQILFEVKNFKGFEKLQTYEILYTNKHDI